MTTPGTCAKSAFGAGVGGSAVPAAARTSTEPSATPRPFTVERGMGGTPPRDQADDAPAAPAAWLVDVVRDPVRVQRLEGSRVPTSRRGHSRALPHAEKQVERPAAPD